MSVLTAVQHDQNFKSFYERLKAKGKHTTSVQIAVMRKIILTAHSLYKNNVKYDVNLNNIKESKMDYNLIKL